MPDETNPRKNNVQRLKAISRRLRITELIAVGFYSSRKIAAEYEKRHGEKIACRTVRNDMVHVHEMLRKSAVDYLQAAIGRELLILGKLEREAWEAWERSKLPAETKRMVKHRAAPNGEAAGQPYDETMSVEQSTPVGDVRYLDMVLKVHERKCKLFGLDAPEKIDLLFAGAGGPAIAERGGATVSEIRENLLADADYLEYLRERAGRQDAAGAGTRLGLAGPDGPQPDASG